METKQYLNQITRLDRMIQNKLSEIYQLKTMACNVTVSNDSERVKASSENDKIGSIVTKIVDIENEVDRMIDKRSTIVGQIDNMQDTDMYDVLAKRYILGKDLKVIAIERGVSFRYIGTIHKKAIEKFEEKYGIEYLDKCS